MNFQPLTRAEYEALTEQQRNLRRALWARTVERLHADHDARYHAPARRDVLRRAS